MFLPALLSHVSSHNICHVSSRIRCGFFSLWLNIKLVCFVYLFVIPLFNDVIIFSCGVVDSKAAHEYCDNIASLRSPSEQGWEGGKLCRSPQ